MSMPTSQDYMQHADTFTQVAMHYKSVNDLKEEQVWLAKADFMLEQARSKRIDENFASIFAPLVLGVAAAFAVTD